MPFGFILSQWEFLNSPRNVIPCSFAPCLPEELSCLVQHFPLFYPNLRAIGAGPAPWAASEADEEWGSGGSRGLQVFLDLSVQNMPTGTLSTARQEAFKKSFAPGSYSWLECLASQGICFKKDETCFAIQALICSFIKHQSGCRGAY